MSEIIATIEQPQAIVAVVEAGTSVGSSSLAAYDAALLKIYQQAKEDYKNGKIRN